MKAILIIGVDISIVFARTQADALDYAEKNDGIVIDEENSDKFSNPELVQGYNSVAELEPEIFRQVNRFTSKTIGLQRVNSMCVRVENLLDYGEKVNVTVVGSKPVPKPTIVRRKERWRREKYTPPGPVSYAPRKGSLQEKMVKILTKHRKGELVGVTAEKFCADTNEFSGLRADKNVLWAPSNMWSQLNYLFVTQKGYGMRFNGTHIMLIESEQHRVAS